MGSRLPKRVGFFESSVNTATSSDGRATGNGFRNSVFISVNIVVLAPTPRASDSTAVVVRAGLLRSVRSPYRMSCQRRSIVHLDVWRAGDWVASLRPSHWLPILFV